MFDQEVFDASGSVSGGVCVGCRSNTAGMNLYIYVFFFLFLDVAPTDCTQDLTPGQLLSNVFSSLFILDT